MDKQRVTLRLDVDVVAALKSADGSSMSAVANESLRDALGIENGEEHRQALGKWLDELDEKWGHPSPEAYARAEQVLDEARGLRGSNKLPPAEKSTTPDEVNI